LALYSYTQYILLTPEMQKLIDSIELPADLRSLDATQLKQVAEELRDELIDSVADSGGHFASSLGATEITVALHHMFDTPNDKLIWDVGHQAYIHKMLTGRRHHMKSIRKINGLSGFLKRSESVYDAFGAGHAGTSISAAVGMGVALQRLDPSKYVVAIIGDGSMTAGMAFEAMNNAGALGLKNLIVVLNDNEMSISPNVGAISWLFSTVLTSKASTIARSGFKSLYKKGYIPEIFYKAIDRAEEMTQGFIAGPSMLFEAFGFRYIGPVDGHSIEDLITALRNAKQQDVPVLIHVRTVKGKGYEPAESDPVKWHGVNPFDRSKGEFAQSIPTKPPPPTYTSVFADTVLDLALQDKRIVGITAAMPSGTGLDKLQKNLPESFFDVGISEQHAVTFAAGLACEGFKPICAIYSTFLQRAYDQVIHDVCIQNLPVVFALDRAGAVGNDGETHQGAFDISYLRTIPNITIMSPKDENEFRHMIYTAVKHDGPIAIRYPRGNASGITLDNELKEFKIGKAEILSKGQNVLIIALGPLVNTALTVAKNLKEKLGLTSTIINARFAKPLDKELLLNEITKHDLVCTLEDGALAGGFGSSIIELVNDVALDLQKSIVRFGMKDDFIPHASQAEQYHLNGYDANSMYEVISNIFSENATVNSNVIGI
jgi:1-deoxy-D-xylulose-5-phosphate synthase